MKKLAALTLSLFLTAGTALADSPKDADTKPAKAAEPAKPKAAKKAEKSDSAIAAEIEELRQALQSQQEQLQLLKEELAKRDRQIDGAREAAAAANARAAEAGTKASEAVNSSTEVKTTAATLNSTVSDLKASNEVLKTTVAKEQAQAQKAAEEGPSTIKYKGINITPGGFLDAAGVFRSRATSADINTPLTGIPYPGNSLSKVSELNFSGRHSRVSLLVEGKLASAKIGGYYEADFLGAGTTSNNRQSNSYVLRQRQAFAQVAFDNGLSLSAGQMWSLVAEDKKGIVNRSEIPPLVEDPQYVVGWTWARQYGFRAVKSFAKDKVAVAFAVEAPQTTFGGRGFSTFTPVTGNPSQNFFINAPGAGGGLFNAFDATGYTTNKAPDVIFKVALDPGFGHYEVFGIVSTFRNRVYPCAVVSPAATNGTGTVVLNGPALTGTSPGVTCTNTSPSAVSAFNDTRTGGGGGASFNVPLFSKKVDFGVKAVVGDGIGRYGSAQLADATFRPDGTLALIRGEQALARIEVHPTPKLDLYIYGGNEYAWRAAYTGYSTDTVATSQIVVSCTVDPVTCPQGFALQTITTHNTSNTRIGGYGSPFANNSGCSAETSPTGSSTPGTGGTCAGDIRNILEGSVGFWHKIYQGPHGGVRWGIQYSYLTKIGWSGNNNNPAAIGIQPKAVENMVLTSFRYYLP